MVFQVHRRFQITFLSSSAVLEFIDAIRTICPCKANPIPGPGPAPGPVPPRNTTMAMQTFNPPSDTRMTPSYTTTVEQPRQDNPLSGLPSSLGPPLFPPRSIQEPTHGLQIPFSSSQGFALTSEPNVYQSSPLQGLASCVPNSSTESVFNAVKIGSPARLLNSRPIRSFKTYKNKSLCPIRRHLPLQGEAALTRINHISPIATQLLTRITVLS